MVHFAITGAQLAETEETKELAARRRRRRTAASRRRRRCIVGRFGARARGRGGRASRGGRRHARAALLRPRDGTRDLRQTRPRKEQAREQSLDAAGPPSLAASRASPCWSPLRRARLAARRSTARTRASPAASRSTASGPAPRRAHFRRVINAFNKTVPRRQGQLQAGRRQPADGGLDRGRRRPSARHGRHRPARPDQAVRRQGRAEADHVRRRARSPRTSRRRGSSSAPSTASSTASSSRRATSRPSGTTSHAFKNAGVTAPETWPQLHRRTPNTIKASGVAALLDRRRRRLDAHRPVREHLPPAGRRRRSTTRCRAHKIKWTDPSVTAALKTMAQVLGNSREHGRRHVGRSADRLPDLGQQRLPEPAEGGDRDGGRLRPGRRDGEGEGRDRLRRVPVPVDQRLRARRSRSAATRSSRSATPRRSRRS